MNAKSYKYGLYSILAALIGLEMQTSVGSLFFFVVASVLANRSIESYRERW
jgi:hypothetical protein